MASFDEECDRLSRVADPAGALKRDWDKNEGYALKSVKREIKKLFDNRDDLVISFSDEHQQEDSIMVVYPAGRSEPIVGFMLRPKGTDVGIWPTRVPNARYSGPTNPKVTMINGGWDEEALGAYFAEIFAEIG